MLPLVHLVVDICLFLFYKSKIRNSRECNLMKFFFFIYVFFFFIGPHLAKGMFPKQEKQSNEL